MGATWITAWLALHAGAAHAAEGDGIERLSPKQFPELPAVIAAELDRRGCSIPQSVDPGDGPALGPHNVISGSFRVGGQRDWAVLCSRDQASAILVFWADSVREVSELARSEDRRWVQGMGEGRMGFSRRLSVWKADSSPETLGIEDAFAGKASTVHRWQGEAWVAGPGAD